MHYSQNTQYKPRVVFESVALVLLVFTVMVVSRIPAITSFVLYVIIPVAVVSALLYARMRMVVIPEMVLWIVLIGWSATGIFYAAEPSLVMNSLNVLIGIGALWIPLSILIARRGRYAAFLSGVLISALYLLFTGLRGNLTISSANRLITDLVNNPNGLAFVFLYGAMSSYYLAKHAKTGGWRVIFITFAFSLIYGILATGSRKTFAALIVFLIVYLVWRRTTWKVAAVTITFGVITYLFSNQIINTIQYHTAFGQRMVLENLEHGAAHRQYLIQDALDVFSSNPVAGVGLGNFVLYSSSGLYAHNDVLEILSTTGLIGFCIYFSLYIVLGYRLFRLLKITNIDTNFYDEIVFARASLVALAFIGLGSPNFLSINTMLFIGAVMFQSHYLKRYNVESSSITEKF